MAEQEIIKHTKNALNTWGSDKGFWHKLKDFVLEIFIIVFAITLSIYLHDRSEKKHQRHETEEFLLGLKEDLKTDLVEMSEDKKTFQQSSDAFKYITSVKMNEKLNADTLKKYENRMFNSTGFVPNDGRFEGFKSSGKIGNIENAALQNNIMDLYQENIPALILSTDRYAVLKRQFQDYVYQNKKRLTDTTDNFPVLLTTDPAINISRNLVFIDEILSRYNTCIAKINRIIADIGEEYEK